MTASRLQQQTEAMWKAVAEGRRGKAQALLVLDGLARWDCPSERLSRAARRNVVSILGSVYRTKAERLRHPSPETRRRTSRPAGPGATPSG